MGSLRAATGRIRRVLQLHFLGTAVLAAVAEDACPANAGGCASAASTSSGGEYWWPHGRGHPWFFGQSPLTFGSQECNLTASLKWSWQHPQGRYFTTLTGKPLVDDEVNIYIATEDSIRKFSPDGNLLWTWLVPGFKPLGREIPNHPAIMDGLIYNCLTTGEVFALDMRSGALVWMVKVSDRGIGTDTAFTIARDGMVLLDVDQCTVPFSGNRVVALNGTDGSLLWEFQPDTGVWNFLPLFPGDGSIVFQSWSGSAYRVNLSDGKLLWRAGTPPGGVTWTDGGAALGPNGVLYTVSSTGEQGESFTSSGGGLHAFRVSDGKLLWEKTDFDQGIYTYPVVGRLNPGDDRLSVVTGVGSLCGMPLRVLWGITSVPLALMLGPVLAILRQFCCKPRAKSLRKRCARFFVEVLACVVGVSMLCLLVLALTVKKDFRYSVQAFDAETGQLQWRLELPIWPNHASAGDAEGAFVRLVNTRRYLCLPLASSYPTLDAQGALFMGHFDGKLYRIKDWDGDGRIDPEKEVCSFEAGSAFPTGGPTLAPGMLLASSCDTLYVFEQ